MSSTTNKMPFSEALALAKELVDDLTPHVQRVKVAGSLRRRRPEVNDLEIVCEPIMEPADLFGGLKPNIERIRAVLQLRGEILKGGERYIQVRLFEPAIKADLFIVHPPANWWAILAIRTGPWQLGRVAVTRMHGFGYRCVDGRVTRAATGEDVPLASEDDFFRCAGMQCLPPHQRDAFDAMLPSV